MIFNRKKKKLLLNIAFVLSCLAILLFLANAPDETTAKLPLDEQHLRFQKDMDKKEAERHCVQCHSPEGEAPLPEGHPPKYRCLFCHKRQQ